MIKILNHFLQKKREIKNFFSNLNMNDQKEISYI